MSRDVTIPRQDAEKIVEMLEGYSLLLRSALPDRLFELLKSLDQTGVYEPLRYDMPMGPEYVADEVGAVRRRLNERIQA